LTDCNGVVSIGAGKTTLLNIIAQRYRSGKVGGTLAFNNEKLSSDTIKKYGGYVMQGARPPTLTTR